MKVLFFDIDGTLLDGRCGIDQIPSPVVDELLRIKAMGNKVLIATGRPKIMLSKELYTDLFDGYIFMNGGYIEIDHKTVYEDRMNYDMLKKLCSLLKQLNFEYMIESKDHIYMQKDNPYLFHFFDVLGKGDMFTYVYQEDDRLHETIKVEAGVAHDRRKELEGHLSDIFKDTVKYDVHGMNNIFEIYPATLSKARGIQIVLDYYGVSQLDSYAFGDGTNDIEMLEYVNCGVAMGNAEDLVKEHADIVCDHVADNGLGKILKQLF